MTMRTIRRCSWWLVLASSAGFWGCVDRQSPAPDPAEVVDGAVDAASDFEVRVDGSDGDAMTPDAAPTDAAPVDAAVTDAAPDAAPPDARPPDPAGGTHFIDTGRCFEHTPRCGVDDDCDPDRYRGCIDGRCHLDVPCGCASDDDCAPGDLCVTNERVCGLCVPAPQRCPDGVCLAGGICVDGWCRDDCPGHGDGPPLDCRGEPDIGRCSGRWAYLREVGTCVPVDDVPCGAARNAFDDRAACLTHCRGPVACTATIVQGGEMTGSVECPITHGPGACVALAHCLCELGEAMRPDLHPREARRLCAMSWTVPRGAITFADFCGEESLLAVVGRMRDAGFAPGLFDPDAELVLSPGCGAVLTDRSIGPMCQDGVQNGWETGVDCGPLGCDACP